MPALKRHSRFLLPGQPINWRHPLNNGLIGEWAVTTNGAWNGGQKLYDLVRGSKPPHDGTLTNAPTWQSDGIKFTAASTQKVACGSLATGATFPLSACFWFKPVSSAGNYGFFDCSDGGGVNGFQVELSANGVATRVDATGAARTSATITSGQWTFGAAVWTSTTLRAAYVHGTNKITATGASTTPSGAVNLSIGFGPQFTRYMDGTIDKVSFYNRALSDAEIMAMYLETRAGNPNRWNWINRKTMKAAAVTSGLLLRRRRMMGVA